MRKIAIQADRALVGSSKGTSGSSCSHAHLCSLQELDDLCAWRGNAAWEPLVRLAGRTQSLDLSFTASPDLMGVRRPGLRRPGVRRPGIGVPRQGAGDSRDEQPSHADGGRSSARSGRTGFGWLPDIPDRRDRTPDRQFLAALNLDKDDIKRRQQAKRGGTTPPGKEPPSPPPPPAPPDWVDLRPTGLLSPIENQGDTNSCTAHAVTSLLEVLYRRLKGKHEHLSRLFLYKAARNLDGFTTDDGSYIRSAVKAARYFGVPPESFYPFDESQVNGEPPAFAYSYANNMKCSQYVRLDSAQDGDRAASTLNNVRRVLAAGHAVAFGFSVYESLWEPQEFRGEVPFPHPNDEIEGGHAVLAVGYDDQLQLPSASSKGALLIQNSWGLEWGEFGFGYLPYEYVHEDLAYDFWAIHNADWIDDSPFCE